MQLVTWNIQACRGCDGEVSPRRIVEHARALGDFDVLCLQEVAANFPALKGSRGEDQFAELAALLPGFTLASGATVDTLAPDGSRRRFGNAVFSRLPVLQVLASRLPRPGDPQARRTMQRGLLEAVVQAAFGPVRVMTTHLEFFSARQREAQVAAILQRHAEACLRAHEPEPQDTSGGPFHSWPEPEDAILAGDFNFSERDPLYRRLQARDDARVAPFADAWVHANPHHPCPPTVGVHDRQQWPQAFTCDFVFGTPRLLQRLRRVAVDGGTAASDHQPVLVALEAA